MLPVQFKIDDDFPAVSYDQWKEVVTRLGGEPKATHDFETRAARRIRRYYYECNCEKLHAFAGRSHRRVRYGRVTYSCRKCGQQLAFTGIEGYE